MDSKQYIKQLLTSDPKGAIDRLLLLINQSHNTKLIKEHEHNLILNQGRYLGAESEYKSGLISRELFYTERQNVVNSILGVIDSLPKDLFVAKNAEFDILQQADLTFNETIDKVVKYSNASAFEYDIFFSFSSKDKIQAKLIVDELRGIGFKVFFSDEDLKKYVGLSFVDKIGFALQNSSHFIWHCTPNSAKSPWVKNEFGIFYTQIHMQSPQERQFFILEGEGFLESDIPLFYLNIQTKPNYSLHHQ